MSTLKRIIVFKNLGFEFMVENFKPGSSETFQIIIENEYVVNKITYLYEDIKASCDSFSLEDGFAFVRQLATELVLVDSFRKEWQYDASSVVKATEIVDAYLAKYKGDVQMEETLTRLRFMCDIALKYKSSIIFAF